MNEVFDLYNLIFLGLAVFIFLKLRGVLGRRTGNERKPFDPYSAPEPGKSQNTNDDDDRVVPLPGRADPRSKTKEAVIDMPDWSKIAPKGSELEKDLLELHAQDQSFDPVEFLDGAKVAYEMIVIAFADGDKRSLKNLLSSEVYDSFASVIDGREERGEIVESNFVGIEKANILEVVVKTKQASITVKFLSELISATRNSEGETIEGDPKKTKEVVDIWTFSCLLHSLRRKFNCKSVKLKLRKSLPL